MCVSAVHLCEACCRREHELHSITAWDKALAVGPQHAVKAKHYSLTEHREYAARPQAVSVYMAGGLGDKCLMCSPTPRSTNSFASN